MTATQFHSELIFQFQLQLVTTHHPPARASFAYMKFIKVKSSECDRFWEKYLPLTLCHVQSTRESLGTL